MPVEALDLKPIWESGQPWSAWLAGCQQRADMERIYGEVRLPPQTAAYLRALQRPVHLLALAEDWCGDVRRNMPAVARVCAENPALLRLRCVDKATRPQLMVRYLTNGAEAIPLVIFLNDAFVEVGRWGPRPAECKRAMARGKAANKKEAAYAFIHAFYERDKQQSTISEVRELIEIAAATEV